MTKLYKISGALPYLLIVFINAFVDLGHKITIQNTVFKAYDDDTQVILTAIVNGLILLPFILLFSPAGFIADKYPKNHIIRAAAWVAVLLTTAITVCYYQGWFWLAFVMTFLLAMQSAFYSPAKYGYIKALFGKGRLGQANGHVQAVTIVAILLGAFAFSILFEWRFPEGGTDPNVILKAVAPLGWLLIISSLLELILTYRLPQLEPLDVKATFAWRNYLQGRLASQNLKSVINRDVIRLSIIGLAIFWSVGQVMLAAFPAFAKETIGTTNTIVIQSILAACGVGIAIGSVLAARWSRHHIETGLIPIGALGICCGLFIMPQLETTTLHALNYLFIGIMGGLFIVPLNSLIQFHAQEHELGNVLATNNLCQNLSMMTFLIATALFALLGLSTQGLLIGTAFIALLGSIYTVYKLPQSLVRLVLSLLAARFYRINVQHLNNLPEQGGVLLLGNHISWLDWAILQIACPRPIRFVMIKSIYEKWYLTWFLKIFGTIPIESNTSSRRSLERVASLLNSGAVVCLFPEGSISRTGHLAAFRRGYEKVGQQANDDVVIVPFYLRGLWGSQFSRSSQKLKHQTRLSRDIIVAFGAPLSKNTGAEVLKSHVFDLSMTSWQQYADTLPTLPHAWIDTVKRSGGGIRIADTLSASLSAQQALTAAIAFSKRISKLSSEQNIGLLLPTSAAGILTNMATLLCGKTVVNLNFTASQESLRAAIKEADIKTIYSSERFLKKLTQKGINLSPILQQVNVIDMQTLKDGIPKTEMLRILLAVKLLPARCLKALYCKAHDPHQNAAILFSSGSEGAAKGVMLSHRNIMVNLKQVADVLNTNNSDVMMASLPLFHAFGLTVTQFMPLIEDLPMVCHADPTDALNIAKAIAKYKVTLLCGTSTFFRLYTKNSKIHPLMLDSLRLVVAGAEKLNPSVRDAFNLKFNKTIFEGYGATETAPVASVNLPDALDESHWQVQVGNKAGTVGMPLPGSNFKIVDPDSFTELANGEAGMVLIGGPQLMQGYLNNPQKTAEVIKQLGGLRWYVSGDKGRLDADGFLTLIDRYSRFAKLVGEMISLTAVEDNIRLAMDASEIDFVAINLPDLKKGEKIVVLCTTAMQPDNLRHSMLANGCNPLMIPNEYYQIAEIPKLGAGKTDFKQAKTLALELSA
jgi:acyl-[acyl-carrier-protein]-phospholipid O-acyltransferase / long-chain-fatty-acid--[acyl-carrier-protein] ligase